MHTITVTKPDQTVEIPESGIYQVVLEKPGATVQIHGVFQTHTTERVDVELTIIHAAPHTRANTVLKGVARDASSLRFFGRIIIQPDCGDSQSFLEERILLLSEKAKAEAVPELEILTDDVQCSHAASIARIPEEHLFYLMSRGIPQAKAEGMIVEGFLE